MHIFTLIARIKQNIGSNKQSVQLIQMLVHKDILIWENFVITEIIKGR